MVLPLTLSYLVAGTYALPFSQSAIILILTILLNFLYSANDFLAIGLLQIILFLVILYIKKRHVSHVLSFSYLLFAFLVYNCAFTFLHLNFQLENTLSYILHFALMESLFGWLIAIVFIYLINLFFKRQHPKIDLEK